MIRRKAHQRRDYIYRRALILKDAEIADKRAKLRSSLASGRPLDPNIANDEELRKDYKYDESKPDLGVNQELELDDEYSLLSGLVDPRILITTSRNPSTRLLAFTKELRLMLPTSIKLNRGNQRLAQIMEAAIANGLSDMIFIHEHRGTPTALTLSHLPHGPTIKFSLHNVILRHDIPNSLRGTVNESYPHLAFEDFTSPLGIRVKRILKHIFPPRWPIKPDGSNMSNRIVSFFNTDDTIEIRHHVFTMTGRENVEIAEVGPRMMMKLYEIRNGTMENKDADVEWSLSQYTRTGKKKSYLS